jgi:alkanesulfonate monooxygenase SsuD/methylene tetrahydromethanopterin reductase-like flavin-dependent oxidoreductase (luciferase family)
MKHLLYLPPFGELADPRLLADLAAEAEAAGWDGVFLWDHVLRRSEEAVDIVDPWVSLAAMAMTTSTIRVGPLVTPLTRRRPIKVAREIATLDLLSQGRLTVGFGLGVDTGGELSRFGEEVDPRIRADRLDESLGLLDDWLSRGHSDRKGTYFSADDVIFGTPTVQRPRPPFWFAVRGTALRPARRAARFEGIFPIEMDLDGLQRVLEVVGAERGSLDGFDVVVSNNPESGTPATMDQLQAAGVTWIAYHLKPNTAAAEVRQRIASLR